MGPANLKTSNAQTCNVFIDTHCHLDLDQFDSDREAVLERAARADLTRILIPGLDVVSSRAVVKLARSHPMLFAAVGVHPTEAATWTTETDAELRDLINPSLTSDPSKIVAIGEIGLDYYWNTAPPDLQRSVLHTQLNLAAEAGLPVILHMREASNLPDGGCAGDLMQVLEEWVLGLRSGKNPLKERPGVLHSFSGSLETARAAMSLGFYIGVTGAVTFKNAGKRQEIVSLLPLDRILIETDAPFQAPLPYWGKRNEPAYVRLIADKIALLHSCSLEQVAAVTSENARSLFAWKEKD
jgi:TatD DNase family protein